MVNFVELDSTSSVLVLLAPHVQGRLRRKADTDATDVLVKLTYSSLLLTVAVRWLLAAVARASCRKLLRNQQLASVSYLDVQVTCLISRYDTHNKPAFPPTSSIPAVKRENQSSRWCRLVLRPANWYCDQQ